MVTTAEDAVFSVRKDAAARPSRWARVTPRQRDALAFGILLAFLLLPLRGVLHIAGAQMEEGSILVFPERLLAGDIPNRDFLHLYGPGSLWVLAGVYKVFGTDLVVERLFGLLQQAGLMFGVYFVARLWGRTVGVVCACLATLIMLPPAGITVFAWTGAVALGMLGIATALHARTNPSDRAGQRLAVLAGILFGTAFLFRLDLVVALALALVVVAWRAPRARVVPLLVSSAATASLLLVQFALAGFGNAFRGMVLEPVFDLRPGRHLPMPPSWGSIDGFLQRVGEGPDRVPWLPALPTSNQLFLWFFGSVLATALLLAVGTWAIRRDPTSIRARAVLASGGFSLGMVSQMLQRPDSTHIAWVSCISIALVPIALMEIIDARRDAGSGRGSRTALVRHRRLVACAVPTLALLLIVPNFTIRTYGDFVAQTFGYRLKSWEIERNGRTFLYGDAGVALAANTMIADMNGIVRPGDRLFVGPVDLSRTVTSEAWLYHLFPEMTPGTTYIEMDPGIADARGSGLAQDLRSSDVVVLSRVYENWAEPNASVEHGDRTPNRVLRKNFCHVRGYEPWFELYTRCDRVPK